MTFISFNKKIHAMENRVLICIIQLYDICQAFCRQNKPSPDGTYCNKLQLRKNHKTLTLFGDFGYLKSSVLLVIKVINNHISKYLFKFLIIEYVVGFKTFDILF